MWKNKI